MAIEYVAYEDSKFSNPLYWVYLALKDCNLFGAVKLTTGTFDEKHANGAVYATFKSADEESETPGEESYNLKIYALPSSYSFSNMYGKRLHVAIKCGDITIKDNDKDNNGETYRSGAVSAVGYYKTSNGILFRANKTNEAAPNGYPFSLIVTKNQEGKTTICLAGGYTGKEPEKNTTEINIYCVADGDEAATATGTTDTTGAANNYYMGYSHTPFNYTLLVPFTSNQKLNTISYTPKAFYMPVSQYREHGILTIGETDYATDGLCCLQDG